MYKLDKLNDIVENSLPLLAIDYGLKLPLFSAMIKMTSHD